MATDVSFARLLLESLGAKVEPIATGFEKRADFIARVGGTSTLIEEKTKLDDPDDLAERQQVLDTGQPYATHVPIKPDNRLSGITYEAAKQIATTARAATANFKIVWFTAAR